MTFQTVKYKCVRIERNTGFFIHTMRIKVDGESEVFIIADQTGLKLYNIGSLVTKYQLVFDDSLKSLPFYSD